MNNFRSHVPLVRDRNGNLRDRPPIRLKRKTRVEPDPPKLTPLVREMMEILRTEKKCDSQA